MFTSRDPVYFDEEARLVTAGKNHTWRWNMDDFETTALQLAARGEEAEASPEPEPNATAGETAPSLGGPSTAPGGETPAAPGSFEIEVAPASPPVPPPAPPAASRSRKG